MVEVRFLVGPQCSGKTTIAKETGLPVVSRDTFREAFCYDIARDGYDNNLEELITTLCDEAIQSLIAKNLDFVVDNLNLKRRNVTPIIRTILKADPDALIRFQFMDDELTLEELYIRNRARSGDTGKFIPEAVIEKAYNLFKRRRSSEMYEWVQEIKKSVEGEEDFMAPVNNPELPPCVIFDIDGTLAWRNGREWFEYEKVETDLVDPKIAIIHSLFIVGNEVNQLVGPTIPHISILVVSGRDSSCREQTEAWLKATHITYDELHMRPEGDRRPDWIIKQEILHEKILTRYCVQMVFDDRDQVVDMWRRNGIKCLQVEPGNF